jgi:hypothetical protein
VLARRAAPAAEIPRERAPARSLLGLALQGDFELMKYAIIQALTLGAALSLPAAAYARSAEPLDNAPTSHDKKKDEKKKDNKKKDDKKKEEKK